MVNTLQCPSLASVKAALEAQLKQPVSRVWWEGAEPEADPEQPEQATRPRKAAPLSSEPSATDAFLLKSFLASRFGEMWRRRGLVIRSQKLLPLLEPEL